MYPLKLLMWAVLGWSALGVMGVSVSLARGERRKAVHGLAWLAGVWVVYLGVLAGVSLMQPQRVLAVGEEQCFDAMCFTVTGAKTVPGFQMQGFQLRDGSRLVAVSVRVRNRGRDGAASDERVSAYLVDAQGRRWKQLQGVGGAGLRARMAAGESMMSEPVFKTAEDARGLGVVLTQGRWQTGTLVIGDSDSLLHRKTVVRLNDEMMNEVDK